MNIYTRLNGCSHFESCSGCVKELTHLPPPIWQEITEYFKGQIKPVLYQGPEIGWRCRAKLAVRGSSTHPLIGLFKKHSHDVIPIPLCLVHHPCINKAIERIRLWMQFHHLLPYQEEKGLGDLRYIQCVVERSTNRVQVAFVLNCKSLADSMGQKWQALLLKLFEEEPNEFWHSIWLNFNGEKTNTIFGDQWLHVCGEKLLWETFEHISICYQPANFAQANLDLFEVLLHRIREWVSFQAKVVEFYAGVGVIGLFIASKCKWVKSEEINPHSQACFLLSKERLPSDIASKITFYSDAAEKSLSLLDEADTVIVDPPRKGLSQILMKSLITSQVKQLIYVSCGWESFKKDSSILMQEGWQLNKLEGYAFFPGSNHIELLACFERKF